MKQQPVWETRAHGKLLLTGEYGVLNGALALALPVRYGQRLEVGPLESPAILRWMSRDRQGAVWFEAEYSLIDLAIVRTAHRKTAEVLQQILAACRRQNPAFLNGEYGVLARTHTEFPRDWGLGTSSTLIAALARWAGVDPYAVLFDTLGGSGYDIACAYAGGPILYRLTDGRAPSVQPVHFEPAFAAHLFFVFLGKKQNSREGIRHYRERAAAGTGLPEALSQCTRQCLEAQTLDGFARVLLEHERLIAQALGLPRAQERFFPDFPGVVKSLGAWGGDFVLAVAQEKPEQISAYFGKKGFSTCIPYRELVL